MRNAATKHGVYIPSGAFWGGEDIKKMADRGTLQVLGCRFHSPISILCMMQFKPGFLLGLDFISQWAYILSSKMF